MSKKLHIYLNFTNLMIPSPLSIAHQMYNLYTKFVKILEICKQHTKNIIHSNIHRCGPVPKFSDWGVTALSLTAETESIDSDKWLFEHKRQEYKSKIPNLIFKRYFNDCKRKASGLREEIRKNIVMKIIETLFSQHTDQFMGVRNYA